MSLEAEQVNYIESYGEAWRDQGLLSPAWLFEV
jgi:hypothetical protein